MPALRHSLASLVLLGALAQVRAAEPPPARPEFANPAFANPDTPGLQAGKPGDASNTVDAVFLKQLAIGGRAEMELGKLADQRGAAAGVKQFGRQMADDHSKANSRLASVASGAARIELPKALDAEHEAARRELAALGGRDFDLRYIDSQIVDHQKAVELLIHEIGSGQDSRVRDFAAQTLPTVVSHLEMARSLHAQLTRAEPNVPPGSSR